jgi:hypothetical protein
MSLPMLSYAINIMIVDYIHSFGSVLVRIAFMHVRMHGIRIDFACH